MQTCVLPTNVDALPSKLSQTGCVNPTNVKAFAASVIPYDVNSPLWSDGADKTRGLALPTGAKIHVNNCTTTPTECPQGSADDGKWIFPVGTVLVKDFRFDGKLLETRLFVHQDVVTWVGYSYAWDEAQTDATIVADAGKAVKFNTGVRAIDWQYPSRMNCMTCHKPTSGSSLGLDTPQMNRPGTTGMNQIDRLKSLDLFDGPMVTPYKAALVTPYASQSGTPPAGATVNDRARSYLQANCAFCHRPDDPDGYRLDLRFGTAFKDMNICGADPQKSDLGFVGAHVLDPGKPASSLMWQRMKQPPDNGTDKFGRMPPLASTVVDQSALDLIGQWITSIPSPCPM